jgi:hypothetical protein
MIRRLRTRRRGATSVEGWLFQRFEALKEMIVHAYAHGMEVMFSSHIPAGHTLETAGIDVITEIPARGTKIEVLIFPLKGPIAGQSVFKPASQDVACMDTA